MVLNWYEFLWVFQNFDTYVIEFYPLFGGRRINLKNNRRFVGKSIDMHETLTVYLLPPPSSWCSVPHRDNHSWDCVNSRDIVATYTSNWCFMKTPLIFASFTVCVFLFLYIFSGVLTHFIFSSQTSYFLSIHIIYRIYHLPICLWCNLKIWFSF